MKKVSLSGKNRLFAKYSSSNQTEWRIYLRRRKRIKGFYDLKSTVLISFNPLLNMIADSQGPLYNLMGSRQQVSCTTATGQISVYWYIVQLYHSRFMALSWTE